LKYGRKEKKGKMQKEFILALGVAAVAAVCTAAGIQSTLEPKEEPMTIAEYMEEYRRNNPRTIEAPPSCVTNHRRSCWFGF